MGRIDEALRRAGLDNPAQDTGTTVQSGQMFVSAWPASGAAEPVDPENSRPRLIQPSGASPFSGFSPEWAERLVVSGKSNHILVEQFRGLAGTLHHAQSSRKLKSLMVTSAVPGDGKTFTSINLALTLAGSYARRVLLIDADLRRPSIDKICGLKDPSGLSEGLRSDTEQKLRVVELIEGLTFLPAGRHDADPLGGLTSPRMKRILQQAEEQFDWIIVDAPPAAPLADAGLIGAMVDSILLVVRAGATPLKAVETAIETLGRDRIFGVVLNGAGEVSFEYGTYYGDRTPADD